jgi:hypothetical protein
MMDPEAFEIAFTVVARADDEPEDDEPIPLCSTCGAPVGIFLERVLSWRTSAATPPPPAPITPTTPVTLRRSPGTSRTKLRKSSGEASAPVPAGLCPPGTDFRGSFIPPSLIGHKPPVFPGACWHCPHTLRWPAAEHDTGPIFTLQPVSRIAMPGTFQAFLRVPLGD